MGIGDSWGTREELLHPRDKNGRFRDKWKMPQSVANALANTLASFNPRIFGSEGQSAQYIFGKAKPSRFRGGTEFARLSTDFAGANKALRSGNVDPTTKKFVQMMDESSVDLPEDIIVSRVIDPQSLGLTPETMDAEEGGAEDLSRKLIGDRGYQSMRIGTPRQKQPGQIEMRVAVPKGTKVIIPATSRGDREVILDHDQEMRITKVTPDGQGGYYVMAVATPRTPGETPAPMNGEQALPGETPAQREARVQGLRQTMAGREGGQQPPFVPMREQSSGGQSVQSDNAPDPRAMVQQPGAPPPRTEPEVTPSIGGGPTPAGPGGPSVAPAPGAPGAPAVDAPAPAVPRIIDLRAAVREAKLPVPSRGKRRRDWDAAYHGLAGPKPKNPDDVLRELDRDIEVHRREMGDLERGGQTDPELPGDIKALEDLRDLIRKEYDRPALTPEPAPIKKAAPAKVAPVKKAAPAAPRTQAGLPKLERPPPPAKKTAPERAPGARGTTTEGRRQAALEAAKASPITGTEGNSYRNIVKGLEGGDLTPAAAAKQARDSAAYFRKSATTAGNFSRPNETSREVERRKATVDRINALADRYENLSVSIKEAGRHAASGPGGRLKSELLAEARQRGIDVHPSWTKDRIGAALRGEAPAPAKKAAPAKAAPAKKAAPEAPAAPGDDLDKMTRNELLQEARKRRLTGYSSKTKDQLKQMIRESGTDDRGLRQVDVPDADAVQQMRKIPKSQITAGDLAVWQPPGEEAVVGRVVQVGPRKTFVDWAGGRRENIAAAKGSPNITFHREGAAPAPAKKATPAKAATPSAEAPAAPAVSEQRIHDVYRQLAPRPGRAVSLADLRPQLGGTREEQDAELTRLNRARTIRLIGESNQKVLEQRHRDASINLGNMPRHHIVIEEKDLLPEGPAPTPAKAAKAAKAAVPGAAPGTAAGKITAARLQPGTRILVAAESNGRWLPTNRKTDSLSVEVVRVDRVQGGTTPGGRGTSRARIRVTTRDELGRETATNVSPSQTLLVQESSPAGAVPPAAAPPRDEGVAVNMRRPLRRTERNEMISIIDQLIADGTNVPGFQDQQAGRGSVKDILETLREELQGSKKVTPDEVNLLTGNIFARLGLGLTTNIFDKNKSRDDIQLRDLLASRLPAITEVATGIRTPAVKAARTKVDGPKATTPVLAPDRKKTFRDAVTEMELNLGTDSVGRQTNEIFDEIEAGKLTPEEGIRRLETEISMNKEEIADLDRAIREETNRELKRIGIERRKRFADSVAEQERGSVQLRKHFGKEPAVTTDEVVVNLPAEDQEALNNATLAELKKAAEGLGITAAGRTKKQFLDAVVKKLAENELERRGLLKKAPAPKAADGPAKDLPAAKWERVNVSALAEGLGLETAAARERVDKLQKEFDEEKLTPKKIAEGLRGHARMVSWGGVVEKQVGIRDDNDPDRNEAARAKGDKLLGEGRKLLELADRIEKVRRRRPSDKPEPEKPKLSAPEKAEIKQVAELTDIPAETLAKKALAKKKADAPPPRTAQQVVDTLLVTNSDEESNAILKGHTKAELLDIAKAVFVQVKPGDSKQKIIDTILGAGALHRAPPEAPAPSGGALTRAQLQEMTIPEIKALEDELGIKRGSLARATRIDAILKAQSAAPKAAAPAADMDQKVQDAYRDLSASEGSMVSLASLRERIGGTRQEQDEVLIRLSRERKIRLVSESDQASLTQAQRDAGINLGNMKRHHIVVEGAATRADAPTPAPTPAPPAVTTPLKIGPGVSSVNIKRGDKIWIGEDEDGWGPTKRKSGSLQLTVGQVERVMYKGKRGYRFSGVDQDGNRRVTRRTHGQNTYQRVEGGPSGPGTPAARAVETKVDGPKVTPQVPAPADSPEVEAARTRQADIDQARKIASAATEWDEILSSGASPEALLARLRNAEAREGVDLSRVIQSVENGDMKQARTRMGSLVDRANLVRRGDAGKIQQYHAASDQLLPDETVGPSGRVRVLRPGYSLKRGDELITLSRPIVVPVDDEPAAETPRGPKLSTKPILENTWGGRRSEIHFHADGAIGGGLRGLKEDDRRLEVNGDALENVIGRIATDLVTGQITGDEQIDRLRSVAAGLPDGPAKRAVSRMVSDLDAPRPLRPIKVPDAGQYTEILQKLMDKLLQIPLARGGSRVNRQDFNEVDLLLDYIKELRTTRAPSILAEDLRRKLWNKRHESMEGKLAIDRAIEAAIKEMKDMKRQPS